MTIQTKDQLGVKTSKDSPIGMGLRFRFVFVVALFVASLSAAAIMSASSVSAYDPLTGDYPWSDAAHVSNPPASDNITWGYTDKTTCDNKSALYNCGTYTEGAYYVYDQWGYYLMNCTSYVAWRVAVEFGQSASGLGYATMWNNNASAKGWSVDTSPEIGDIAHFEGNDAYPASGPGHVAFVEEIGSGANSGKVRIAEYNQGLDGNFRSDRWVTADNYIDVNGTNPAGFTLKVGGSGGAVLSSTASTEDAPYGGDFNGDGWGDALLVHQRVDGGMDVHILFGNIPGYTFANTSTAVRSLPGTSGWDWSKVKIVAGRFNGDAYADLALLHKRTDNGIDVHVLNGGSGTSMLTNSTTFVRSLPGTSGWSWDQVKAVSADFNGDDWDDIALGHKRLDGGMDVHVLWGNIPGYTFANTTTSMRQLPGTDGWNYDRLKLAAGKFNGDNAADLGIVHERSDGGIDIHVLNGGSTPFTNSSTIIRSLTAADGWDWDKVKLAAGDFNGDQWADIALLHQRLDNGADVHVLFGNIPGYTFTNTTTAFRQLPGTSGWDYSKMKLVAGAFNGDQYDDIAIAHQVTGDGIDMHVLSGSSAGSGLFGNTTTAVRQLPASSGWSWLKVKMG